MLDRASVFYLAGLIFLNYNSSKRSSNQNKTAKLMAIEWLPKEQRALGNIMWQA